MTGGIEVVGDEYRGIKVVGNEDEGIKVELEIGARSTNKKRQEEGMEDKRWEMENRGKHKWKKMKEKNRGLSPTLAIAIASFFCATKLNT